MRGNGGGKNFSFAECATQEQGTVDHDSDDELEALSHDRDGPEVEVQCEYIQPLVSTKNLRIYTEFVDN